MPEADIVGGVDFIVTSERYPKMLLQAALLLAYAYAVGFTDCLWRCAQASDSSRLNTGRFVTDQMN